MRRVSSCILDLPLYLVTLPGAPAWGFWPSQGLVMPSLDIFKLYPRDS